VSYRLHGYRLETELPDFGLALTDEGDADITVVRAAHPVDPGIYPETLAEVPHPDGRYAVMRGPSGCALLFFGVASAAFDPATGRIEVEGTLEDETLALLAYGTILAALLALRGECVLHASAVNVEGFTVAMLGNSGRGKSTLAALLCAQGGRLVTDDALRVSADGDGWVGSTEIRLREPVSALDFPERRTSDDRWALTVPLIGAEPTTVGAFVVPRPSPDAAAVEVRRASPREAFVWLLNESRSGAWTSRDVTLPWFRRIAAIAERIPVVEAVIPWQRPYKRELGEELMHEVRSVL